MGRLTAVRRVQAPEEAQGGGWFNLRGRRAVDLLLLAAWFLAMACAGFALVLLTPAREWVAAADVAPPPPEAHTLTPAPTMPASKPAANASPTDADTPMPTTSTQERYPTLDEALAMGEADAVDWLRRIRREDEIAVSRLGSEWVAQLSSKCASLTSADLVSSGEAFGYPDGSAEAYPGGLGSASVLAYHLAMRERFGSGVVLALPQDLGSSVTSSVCGADPLWVTLHAEVTSPTSAGVLSWCDEVGLPAYECGARPLGIPGEDRVVGR